MDTVIIINYHLQVQKAATSVWFQPVKKIRVKRNDCFDVVEPALDQRHRTHRPPQQCNWCNVIVLLVVIRSVARRRCSLSSFY